MSIWEMYRKNIFERNFIKSLELCYFISLLEKPRTSKLTNCCLMHITFRLWKYPKLVFLKLLHKTCCSKKPFNRHLKTFPPLNHASIFHDHQIEKFLSVANESHSHMTRIGSIDKLSGPNLAWVQVYRHIRNDVHFFIYISLIIFVGLV